MLVTIDNFATIISKTVRRDEFTKKHGFLSNVGMDSMLRLTEVLTP